MREFPSPVCDHPRAARCPRRAPAQKASLDIRTDEPKTEDAPMSRIIRIDTRRASCFRSWPQALGILMLGAAIVSAPGCQMQSKKGFAPGLSGVRTILKVKNTTSLGPYLAAHLELNDQPFDAYVIPSEPCRDVFQNGEDVTYVDNGPQGVYRRGDARCQGMGVGNLVIWRNRRRHRMRTPVPRTQVTYRKIYQGEKYALLRGQFPGVGHIGFSNTYDLVAVVPVGGECAPLLDQINARMEYRDKGPQVFSLVGRTGLCNIHGFAQPPPQIPAPELPNAATGSGFDTPAGKATESGSKTAPEE